MVVTTLILLMVCNGNVDDSCSCCSCSSSGSSGSSCSSGFCFFLLLLLLVVVVVVLVLLVLLVLLVFVLLLLLLLVVVVLVVVVLSQQRICSMALGGPTAFDKFTAPPRDFNPSRLASWILERRVLDGDPP